MEDNEFSGSVLLSTFIIKKKKCRVYFHRGILIWETEKQPYTRWTLALTDTLAVNYTDDFVPLTTTKEKDPSASSSPSSFILHYAARGPKNLWSHHSVVMSHSDPRQVASWVKTIRNCLLCIRHRPRRILVFVNPYGGKRKGRKIWEKKVQPLMKIAGIDTRAIITERAGHIHETLLKENLNDFEAIVCIGGDGTFSEVFNGLIQRSVKDGQIDPNDENVTLPRPKLPVGVVPSGSTDTVAYSLHGTTDVQTAVIHIIFGDTTGLDISSVHSDERLRRLYASVFSYGYLGDVIKDSEKFRWMGPQRYEYSGFKKIIANKGYEGEIELLSDPCNPAESTRCTNNCTRCIRQMRNANRHVEIARPVKVSGKFFMVNGANISCACSKCPQGFSPHCHIGDGCVDVILVRHTSLFNNVRMLLRLASKNKNLYDLPFVEVYRAREFSFRARNKSSSADDNDDVSSTSIGSKMSVWNCDGEVFQNVDVRIRVHCQLLKVFTRRLHESLVPMKTCCFP